VDVTDSDILEILRRHTLEGDFRLSSGLRAGTYVDCRAAMLEHPETFRKFLHRKISAFGPALPVATGTGGAIMLATVGTGYLWNPKGHGVEWSPRPPAGTRVVLLDDVRTTGRTLSELRAACLERGLDVVGEVVLFNRGGGAGGGP
jgi:orotate phosphoribosyltransferase